MNNRQLAIQELYEGLIARYGTNPNAKKLISAEIQRFLLSKSKISVGDIENLEEEIKKLCNISKLMHPRPKISVSTTDKYDTINSDSDKRSPISTQSPLKSIDYAFLSKPKGKKIVEKSPDHVLFPNESSNNSLSYNLHMEHRESPSKSKPTNDDWGTIIKADHLKYLSVSTI